MLLHLSKKAQPSIFKIFSINNNIKLFSKLNKNFHPQNEKKIEIKMDIFGNVDEVIEQKFQEN